VVSRLRSNERRTGRFPCRRKVLGAPPLPYRPAFPYTSGMALLRSVATVGGYTMASRILGFVRDMLTAAFLGAGPVASPKVRSAPPSCRSSPA